MFFPTFPSQQKFASRTDFLGTDPLVAPDNIEVLVLEIEVIIFPFIGVENSSFIQNLLKEKYSDTAATTSKERPASIYYNRNKITVIQFL